MSTKSTDEVSLVEALEVTIEDQGKRIAMLEKEISNLVLDVEAWKNQAEIYRKETHRWKKADSDNRERIERLEQGLARAKSCMGMPIDQVPNKFK